MERLPDYVRLLRVGDLAFIAILIVLMEKWVCSPFLHHIGMEEVMPWYVLLLLVVATMLVAAGGYVVNDYFDVKIDRLNKPDKLVVTRVISREGAMHLFMGLTAVGMVCGMVAAWLCQSVHLAVCYVLVPGLLWFYSASYKRQLLIGNLTVSALSALVPLLVAMANESLLVERYGEGAEESGLTIAMYFWMGGFALFAFLITWMREMVKDMEDQVGDREMECHTMPVVWGNKPTQVVVTILAVVTMALMTYIVVDVLPFAHNWQSLNMRYLVFGLLTPMVCEIVLLWSAHTPTEFRTAQQLLKWIMLMGCLYSFVIKVSLLS